MQGGSLCLFRSAWTPPVQEGEEMNAFIPTECSYAANWWAHTAQSQNAGDPGQIKHRLAGEASPSKTQVKPPPHRPASPANDTAPPWSGGKGSCRLGREPEQEVTDRYSDR